MMQDFRLGALAIAEMTGARELGDPRLFVLLAEALIGAELGRDEEALLLLDRAQALSGRNDAWLNANISHLRATALRGKPAEAARAVTRALPLVWEPPARSYLLRERAEAKMALGDVRGSAADARSALSFATNSQARALARYALGLALDRLGDPPQALHEIRTAMLTAPGLVDSAEDLTELAGIFGFRPHDARYVAALVRTVEARDESDLEVRTVEYEGALVEWERFLAEAPADDRFLPLARSHQAGCERALLELKKTERTP
jgi:tetratricopeptide (TPR) repeat protein